MSDTLVVVSKVKNYIKNNGQMNTSSSAMDALTKLVQQACNRAIENARSEGRKTWMDRDFEG